MEISSLVEAERQSSIQTVELQKSLASATALAETTAEATSIEITTLKSSNKAHELEQEKLQKNINYLDEQITAHEEKEAEGVQKIEALRGELRRSEETKDNESQ